jgi:hypothetical protein
MPASAAYSLDFSHPVMPSSSTSSSSRLSDEYERNV